MEKYFDINESGYSVRCKLYCANIHDIKKAVIFGHGFGGHMDNKACEKFANIQAQRFLRSGFQLALPWR